MGDYANYKTQATNYELNSAQAYASSIAAKNQAVAQAYELEQTAVSALEVASLNAMRMQRNKDTQLSNYRAEQASSGFTFSGSKTSAEKSFAEMLHTAITDQLNAASTQAANSYTQAALQRQHGHQQQSMGSIQQKMYSTFASGMHSAAPLALLGQSLSLSAATANQYNILLNKTAQKNT